MLEIGGVYISQVFYIILVIMYGTFSFMPPTGVIYICYCIDIYKSYNIRVVFVVCFICINFI